MTIGLFRRDVARRAEEARVAVGEDAAVARRQPVTRRRGGLAQAVDEDAPVGRHLQEPPADRRLPERGERAVGRPDRGEEVGVEGPQRVPLEQELASAVGDDGDDVAGVDGGRAAEPRGAGSQVVGGGVAAQDAEVGGAQAVEVAGGRHHDALAVGRDHQPRRGDARQGRARRAGERLGTALLHELVDRRRRPGAGGVDGGREGRRVAVGGDRHRRRLRLLADAESGRSLDQVRDGERADAVERADGDVGGGRAGDVVEVHERRARQRVGVDVGRPRHRAEGGVGRRGIADGDAEELGVDAIALLGDEEEGAVAGSIGRREQRRALDAVPDGFDHLEVVACVVGEEVAPHAGRLVDLGDLEAEDVARVELVVHGVDLTETGPGRRLNERDAPGATAERVGGGAQVGAARGSDGRARLEDAEVDEAVVGAVDQPLVRGRAGRRQDRRTDVAVTGAGAGPQELRRDAALVDRLGTGPTGIPAEVRPVHRAGGHGTDEGRHEEEGECEDPPLHAGECMSRGYAPAAIFSLTTRLEPPGCIVTP